MWQTPRSFLLISNCVCLACCVSLLPAQSGNLDNKSAASNRDISPAATNDILADRPVLALDPGGHVGRVWDLAFTPDGSRLVTVSYDKTIRIWDTGSSEPLRVLRPPSGPGMDGRLVCGALSPDGELIAVAGTGVAGSRNAVYVVELATGRLKKVLRGHALPVNVLAFSPDGKRIASGGHDRKLHLWDVANGQQVASHAGHQAYINLLAFSSDGRRIATASGDGTARVWDVATGRNLLVLEHDAPCLAVALSRDGRWIATGSGAGDITLWDANGDIQKHWKPFSVFNLCPAVMSIRFLPDDRRLLFTTDPGGFGVLDTSTGAIRLHPLKQATGCTVSPDGRVVVTADPTGAVQAWDVESGTPVRRLGGKSQPISHVAWSHDGTKIFWASELNASGHPSWDTFDIPNLSYSVYFKDQVRGRRIRPRKSDGSVHDRGAWRLQQSGRTAVLASKTGDEDTRTLTLPNPGTGNWSVSSFTLVDDVYAAIGTGNGNILLFELESGRLVRRLRGHLGEVTSLAPSPDGSLLLSGSNDHSLAMWRLDDEDPLLWFFAADREWVLWSPRGFYAASPGGERLVGWHVGRGPERMAKFIRARQMRQRLFRPKLIVELFQKRDWDLVSLADASPEGQIDLRDPGSLTRLLPPDVRIIAPKQGATLDELSVDVAVQVIPAGDEAITDAFVLVNGRPSPDVRRVNEKGQAFLRGRLALATGANTITAIASNTNASSDPAVVEIVAGPADVTKRGDRRLRLTCIPRGNTEDSAPAVGRLLALCVGVSDYARSQLDLRFAHRDAEQFASVLPTVANPLFKEVVPPRVLIDSGATRETILDGLDWLVEEADPDDVVILFLAGHGLRDDNDSYYLAPHDVDPDRLRATAVRWSDLVGAIRDIRGKVIVLADTCHSGALTGARAVETDPIRELIGENVGAVVFSSAAPWQLAQEGSDWQHGAFTKSLLETFGDPAHDMDRPPDGLLSIQELEFHVTRKVRRMTKGRQEPVIQKPPTIRDFNLVNVGKPTAFSNAEGRIVEQPQQRLDNK